MANLYQQHGISSTCDDDEEELEEEDEERSDAEAGENKAKQLLLDEGEAAELRADWPEEGLSSSISNLLRNEYPVMPWNYSVA